MLDMITWLVLLTIALYILVRGADLFVAGSKQMGAALGMSKFAIGVLIVGFGTSLPELASSIVAALNGQTEIAVANAVGSNITNILLIIGVLAAFGGRIIIKRDLIKTELPIFFISTAFFLLAVYDGLIDQVESFLLLGTFAAYLWYLFTEARSDDNVELMKEGRRPRLELKSVMFILLGIVAVLFGAKFTVEMVINIATFLAVPVGLISITAIALGTSLPELFVTIRAIRGHDGELAIGNIFGSNAFNMLMVIGVPGIMVPLVAGDVVMQLGAPVLLAASTIFFVKGLARRIMRWEGIVFLLFYGFFLIKLMAFL